MLATLLLLCLGCALPAGAAATYVPASHDGDTFPDAALVDQRGRPTTFSDFRGSALVVSFFYARCPDRACSLTSAKFAKLAHGLAHERIHLMEITLDPKHDTVRALAAYGATFGTDAERWTLATGAQAAIADVMARANVVSEKVPSGLAHSTAIVVLDGQGRVFATLDGEATPNEVLREAHAALGDSSNVATRMLRSLGSGIANVCGGKSGVSASTALWVFVALAAAGAFAVRKLFATGAARR